MNINEIPTEQELGIPEQELASGALTSSLTGGQIQECLDTLIYQALTPIVKNSDVFDLQIIYLLGMTAKNRKRRLTALPHDEFITALCNCLITTDREKKISILAESKIERGFVYNFVVNVLDATSGYIKLYNEHLIATGEHQRMLNKRLHAIESNIGFTRENLYTTVNIARDYLDLAYRFRNMIIGNYLRLAYKRAIAFCYDKSDKGSTFDFNCVYQNFLTSIITAVDKYDCSKGALTSYINYWILHAKTTNSSDHGHEYGVAFTIPQLQKKAIATDSKSIESNYSVSLDTPIKSTDGSETDLKDYVVGDIGIDVDLETQQEEKNLRLLIKSADIRGLARLYLDVDEEFTNKELKQMARTTKEQIGERNEKNT